MTNIWSIHVYWNLSIIQSYTHRPPQSHQTTNVCFLLNRFIITIRTQLKFSLHTHTHSFILTFVVCFRFGFEYDIQRTHFHYYLKESTLNSSTYTERKNNGISINTKRPSISSGTPLTPIERVDYLFSHRIRSVSLFFFNFCMFLYHKSLWFLIPKL
jgi:hypothetical protein